jgi:hypothetical protein
MRHGDHAGEHRMVVRHVGAARLAVFQFHGQRVLELPEVAQAGRVVERGRVRRQEVVQDVPVDGLEQAVGPGELGLEDLKDLLRLFGVHDFWAVVGDAGLDNGLHVQTGPALEIQQGAERIHILAGDEIDGLAVSGIQSRQLADDVLKRTVNVLVVECHGWGFLVPGGAQRPGTGIRRGCRSGPLIVELHGKTSRHGVRCLCVCTPVARAARVHAARAAG